MHAYVIALCLVVALASNDQQTFLRTYIRSIQGCLLGRQPEEIWYADNCEMCECLNENVTNCYGCDDLPQPGEPNCYNRYNRHLGYPACCDATLVCE